MKKTNQQTSKVIRADRRLDQIILKIGTLGGIGYIGAAPGTNASLLGALLYPITFSGVGMLAFIFFYALLVGIGIWISDRCEHLAGRKDPTEVNIDELVAMPLCYWPVEYIFHHAGILMPPLWLFLLLGFVFFRILDIAKPFGIKKLQDFHGGVGMVIDDLAAAMGSALCLAAVCLLFAVL